MISGIINVDQEVVVISHQRGTLYEAKDYYDAVDYKKKYGGSILKDLSTGQYSVLSDGIKNIKQITTMKGTGDGND